MEYTKKAILFVYKEYFGRDYAAPQTKEEARYLHESVQALVNILRYKNFYLMDMTSLWDMGRPFSQDLEIILKELDQQNEEVEKFYNLNEIKSQADRLFTPVQLARLQRLGKFAHKSCPEDMSMGEWTQLLSCVYYIRLIYGALNMERGEYLFRLKRGDIDHELFEHLWNTTEKIGIDTDVNKIENDA